MASWGHLTYKRAMTETGREVRPPQRAASSNRTERAWLPHWPAGPLVARGGFSQSRCWFLQCRRQRRPRATGTTGRLQYK